jgi:hypothetical protein
MRLYRLFDDESFEGDTLALEVASEADARLWNMKGWGIFANPNHPKGRRQLAAMVDEDIKWWFTEIDFKDSKRDLVGLLKHFIIPTKVVQSKNGYHVYWKASKATMTGSDKIQRRLQEVYGGDPRARDLTRLLRVPGFYHMKQPKDPFLVTEVWHQPEIFYTEKELLAFLPFSTSELSQQQVTLDEKGKRIYTGTNKVKAWVYSQNQMELLKRLSGSELVNCEVFDFVRQRSGNFNLKINGKERSPFVDKHGYIGAANKTGERATGGPTIVEFCNYYGKYDYKTMLAKIGEYFGI